MVEGNHPLWNKHMDVEKNLDITINSNLNGFYSDCSILKEYYQFEICVNFNDNKRQKRGQYLQQQRNQRNYLGQDLC